MIDIKTLKERKQIAETELGKLQNNLIILEKSKHETLSAISSTQGKLQLLNELLHEADDLSTNEIKNDKHSTRQTSRE